MKIRILILSFLFPVILAAGQLDLGNITVAPLKSSNPAMIRARNELVSALGKITGKTPDGGSHCITLALDASLPPDGFRIQAENGDLQISGGTNYGILYGVYAFLEDDLGCRWYTPNITVIPQLDRLNVTVESRTESPAFPLVRDPFSFFESDPDWALHNRAIRLMSNNLPPELGKRITFPQIKGEFWLCHTTHYFCPNSLFAAHPEYFMIDANGKRSPDQICPCNPEVRKLAIRKILSTLDNVPDANYITLSMEDNLQYCHCPECTAINQREGSDGAAFFDLANEVAAEIEKKHPGVRLIVTAYYATFIPPKHLKIADNITIIYADINRPREVSIQGKPKEYLTKWSRITKEIIIWDYQVDFRDYFRYMLSLRAVAKNLSFYHTIPAVKGVSIQGAYEAPGGARQGLRAWVETKLLWNPGLDCRQLIKDYVCGVYGPAAPPIEKFYLYLDDLEQQQVSTESRYSEMIAFGKKCFDDALKLAGGDPVILNRVKVAELPVLFFELDQLYASRNRESMTEEKRQQAIQLIDEIAAITQTNHILLHHERGSIKEYLEKYREALSRKPPRVPGVTAPDSIVIPASDGMCCMAKKISDPHAAWEKAVQQPPADIWSWQLNFLNQNIPAGKYRIRIRDRIDRSSGKLATLFYGIHDNATKSNLPVKLDPKILDHPDYRWHDLGKFWINSESTLWIMIPTKENDFIHYIDCIELIPEK